LDTVKRRRRLILTISLIYLASFALGYLNSYILNTASPDAGTGQDFLNEFLDTVLTQPPFTTVTEALRGGDLASAILITFTVNLTSGAFLTTTLVGVVPLLGIVAPAITSFLRGFLIGLAYYLVLNASPGAALVGIGTAILELGAYVFSAAAGTNIALSIFFPGRHNTTSRMVAFKEAWKEAGRFFVIVVILLALGAVWEMTGLFLLIH
jgi:uncharacterized membrane protein SpoIIM required for sporulation